MYFIFLYFEYMCIYQRISYGLFKFMLVHNSNIDCNWCMIFMHDGLKGGDQ